MIGHRQQVTDKSVLTTGQAGTQRRQACHRGTRETRGQRARRQVGQKRCGLGSGRDKFGTHTVDQQDGHPAHPVEPESDPVGFPGHPQHAEDRWDQIGEGAGAIPRSHEHGCQIMREAAVGGCH